MSIYSKLRRTVVNEGEYYKLKGLISESDPRYYDEDKKILKLKNLCLRDIKSTDIEPFSPDGNLTFSDWLSDNTETKRSVYCNLYQLRQNLNNSTLADRLDRDLNDIYNFLRVDLLVDNRTKYHSLLGKILEYDNPANSINLVANYVRDSDNMDEVMKSLDSFRRNDVSEKNLEDFLKKAKFSEYTKYEYSFVGSNFKRKPGHLRLYYKTEENSEHIIDMILKILSAETKVSDVVRKLYFSIRRNYDSDKMDKGDLLCTKSIHDTSGNEIIKAGKHVEVKKLDYEADSYLSEFFSIYKRTDLPDYVYKDDFLEVYNKVIDGLFMEFQSNGEDILEDIRKDFAGIMYDDNHFIKEDDITLYWSNKGRATCKQHRLSIRYRINKTNVLAFIFNKESGMLESSELNVKSEKETFCPSSL